MSEQKTFMITAYKRIVVFQKGVDDFQAIKRARKRGTIPDGYIVKEIESYKS